MLLIDSHCHLDFAVLNSQLADVLVRAKQSGVHKFIVPAVSAENWSAVAELARSHSEIAAAAGMHPCFMELHKPEHLPFLESFVEDNSHLVAIGEIGLDLWGGDQTLAEQSALLKAQLEIAERSELPVILHVRKAHDQVLSLLRRTKFSQGGVVHAFSGSFQQAQQYIDLGFKLGFGGSLSYERARKLRKMVMELPLDAIVLETDSPDMLLQGEVAPNEPVNVAKVAQIIAELRAITLEEVAAVTTSTVSALFLQRD